MLLPLLPLLFRYSASNSFWMAATFNFSPMNLFDDCHEKPSWSATIPWSSTNPRSAQIHEGIKIREALRSCCSWLDLCLFPEKGNSVVCYYTFGEYWRFLARTRISYDSTTPPPPSPTPSPVSKRRHTGRLRKRDNLLLGEGGRSQIIRQRESLVLHNSFKTLWSQYSGWEYIPEDWSGAPQTKGEQIPWGNQPARREFRLQR